NDEEMFRSHPEAGARLLAKVPRLENVAQMIARQQSAAAAEWSAGVVERGACLLRTAVELDRWMFHGLPLATSLERLKKPPSSLPPDLLRHLEVYRPPIPAFEIRRLSVNELRTSMVVEADVVTRDGFCTILQKGTLLNSTLIERIRNFDKT